MRRETDWYNVVGKRAAHPTTFLHADAVIYLPTATMPRVRVSSSQNCHEKEGRLLLAVQAIKKEITSIREAACRFNVPESTLRTRLRGTTNRAESRANGHKLTEIEEEVLKAVDNFFRSTRSSSYKSSCTRNG